MISFITSKREIYYSIKRPKLYWINSTINIDESLYKGTLKP